MAEQVDGLEYHMMAYQESEDVQAWRVRQYQEDRALHVALKSVIDYIALIPLKSVTLDLANPAAFMKREITLSTSRKPTAGYSIGTMPGTPGTLGLILANASFFHSTD